MGRGCRNSGVAPLICCEPPFSLNTSLLCKMGLLIPTHRIGEDSVCCCPLCPPQTHLTTSSALCPETLQG